MQSHSSFPPTPPQTKTRTPRNAQSPQENPPASAPWRGFRRRFGIISALLIALAGGTSALHAQYGPVIWGHQKFDIRDYEQPFIAIAGGAEHTLAVKQDGTVAAWGNNYDRQCMVPAGLRDVTAVAAGEKHSLALKSDGSVVAWGYPQKLQTDSIKPMPAGLSSITAIAAGDNHSLALKQDGTIVGWGDNSHSQATPPAELTDVTAIAAGRLHSVALTKDGKVRAWGWVNIGPSSSPSPTGVTAIASGADHVLARKNDGTVVAWGNNHAGQKDVPAGLSGVVAIAAGNGYSAALKNDGTLVVWGRGANTIDNNPDFYGAKQIPAGFTNISKIAAGRNHFVALNAAGSLENWGGNDRGQATRASAVDNLQAVAAGDRYFTLGLRADGKVVAWGDNTTDRTRVPADLEDVIAVSTPMSAGFYSLALKSNGKVVAWPVSSSKPVTQVPSNLSGVTAIAVGEGHAVALRSNGKLFAWGSNSYGQTSIPSDLANVTAIAPTFALKSDGKVVGWADANVPSNLSGITAISPGYGYNYALRANGSLVSWGNEQSGRTRLPASLTSVTAVSCGVSHTLALKNDGTVVGWGGVNPGYFTETSLAAIPPDLVGVTAISAGFYHSVALIPTRHYTGPVALVTQPKDAVVRAGETATFRAVVNVPSRVTSWQWETAPAGSTTFTPIPGATGPACTTAAVSASGGGRQYRAVAVTPDGTLVSQPASLWVLNTARSLNFDTPSTLVFKEKGDAFVDTEGGVNNSKAAKLTLDQLGGSGSLLIDDYQQGEAVHSLVASFRIALGKEPAEIMGTPADGFSFVWGTGISTASTGVFGEKGTGNGLIVSFDTYPNNAENDPFLGAAVKWKGQTLAELHMDLRDLVRFPDYVPVVIKVDADGTLDVAYNGRTLFYNVALPGYAPVAGAGFAWGARTGGSNENAWLDDIVLDARTASTVAPVEPEISIQHNGGNLVISFQGTLQQSDDLGAWADVTGATSPHVMPMPTTGFRFFRAK